MSATQELTPPTAVNTMDETCYSINELTPPDSPPASPSVCSTIPRHNSIAESWTSFQEGKDSFCGCGDFDCTFESKYAVASGPFIPVEQTSTSFDDALSLAFDVGLNLFQAIQRHQRAEETRYRLLNPPQVLSLRLYPAIPLLEITTTPNIASISPGSRHFGLEIRVPLDWLTDFDREDLEDFGNVDLNNPSWRCTKADQYGLFEYDSFWADFASRMVGQVHGTPYGVFVWAKLAGSLENLAGDVLQSEGEEEVEMDVGVVETVLRRVIGREIVVRGGRLRSRTL